MRCKGILISCLLCFTCAYSFSQVTLQYIESRYVDSFTEWVIYFDNEEEGLLELKWPLRDSWTEWRIDVGAYYGTLRQLNPKNPNHWQSKIAGNIIDFRTTYPGDLTRWTIHYNSESYTLYLPYPNQVENWTLESKVDYFDIFTSREGDPRDWSFEKSEDNSIPMELKLSSVALVISLTTPNF